ncbi:DUF5942 domain-containing protein [Acaryochloris sp. IP29b_bin.148]|uniref:DUF5942 domain-containing protein n=1 Tax=Acaryochloris sp. IP29b_bin.148 TaxID=2969218 RepID=UPI00261C89A7|nr:DUF5942 domain-containing protein [Acaryochloris sp. IP29b_bin.148]
MKKWLLLLLFIVGFSWAIANFQGLSAQGKYDSLVLDFSEALSTAEIEDKVNALSEQFRVDVRYNSQFSQADHVFIAEGDAQRLAALKQSDLRQFTESVEPNYVYQASWVPNDPDYGKQWNLKNINMESAWQASRGQGTTVAVIDTGIAPVADLKRTRLVAGYDFVNDRPEATDDHGHGTHVAGTIAQSTNNNFGVAGIAYEAQLMPLKVLSRSGGGTVADIAEAIRFAADNGADVINMSLGGGGASELMQEAIEHAHRQGTVIVAAAGNAARSAVEYPARYPHVIGVAALDRAGQKAPYSNYGAGVDISAPGGSLAGNDSLGGILQNTINPRDGSSIFAAFQGTSMAAPHVAGVAALIRSIGIQNPDQIEQILQQSATAVKDDAANYFGTGRLNAGDAVSLALRKSFGFEGFMGWLRNGLFLGPRFWFDARAVNWGQKLLMLATAAVLAWLLRLPWNGSMIVGLVLGSVGLFILRCFHLVDLPHWPLRVLGSSLPELGGAFSGTNALNPLTANVLIAFGLIILLLSHPQWRWFALGSGVGMTACLAVSAFIAPQVMWLGSAALARGFLGVNALLCLVLVYLSAKTETRSV